MSMNPFVFEGPVTEPDVVYYRDTAAVNSMVNGLLLGKYYTLLGPRLSGITSVTLDILRTARESEECCRCIYIDLRMLPPAADEQSLVQGIASIAEGLPPETASGWPDLKTCAHLRETLVDMVRGRAARLIVAIDHLDSERLPFALVKMLVRCARVLYNQRLTDSEYRKISVLVSGSQSPYVLSTGSGSPFNIAEKYWLRDLTPQDVAQLVRMGEQTSAVQFDAAAIARVVAATEGDKYFVQRVCHQCVLAAQDTAAHVVTEQMVSKVVEYLAAMDYRGDRSFKLLVRSLKGQPDLVEILAGLLQGKDLIATECQGDVNQIRLAGVLKIEGGKYKFRNEIYKRFVYNRRAMIEDGWRIHAQMRQLANLHEVTLAISSALDPETALEEATWMVLEASEADTVAVYLLDKITDRFLLGAVASTEELAVVPPVLKRDHIARGVIASQKPSIIESSTLCGGCGLEKGLCSCIWLPLPAGGDVLGTVTIAFAKHHDFSSENETKAAKIMAAHLASAVIRTRLIEALRTTAAIDITGASRDAVLQKILTCARKLLNVPVALIWGFGGEKSRLRVVTHSGHVDKQYIEAFRLRADVEPTNSFLRRGDPLFLKNVQEAPGYQDKAAATKMGWHSLLTMPLKLGGDPIGIIEVYAHDAWQVTPAHKALLKLMANQAEMTIEKAKLYQIQVEHTNTLRRMYRVSTKLRTSLNPREVLEIVTGSLQKMFDLTTSTVGLLDEAEERLDFVAYKGLKEPTTRLVKDLPQDLWRKVRVERQRIFVEDVARHPELARQLERQDLKSFAVLPLQGKAKFLGILTMSSAERLALDKSDWDLIAALTDQAAVAVENAQLYQEVRQARKALDDSLKVLTHQLRAEPAFVTNTIATLLAGKLGDFNEKQRDRLQKAQRRLDEHHVLIDNINMYGRLKGGRITPREESVKLAQVIRGVVDSRRNELRRRGLTLRSKLRRLPSIEADKGMIETIVFNLLDNAIKFTPAGGHIHVEGWADAGSVRVVVDDTGPGIPVEEREKVFEEYHQIGSTPTRTEKGAGLGLYIAKKFVGMHGGRVAVVDKEGPGTRIEVILPR